jgi:hypothetical protein
VKFRHCLTKKFGKFCFASVNLTNFPISGWNFAKILIPKKWKKILMDMLSVVPNSSSTQNRDLLCFFPFSSVDTRWGSQAKKEKQLGKCFFKLEWLLEQTFCFWRFPLPNS